MAGKKKILCAWKFGRRLNFWLAWINSTVDWFLFLPFFFLTFFSLMDPIELTLVSPDEFLPPEESLTSFPSTYDYNDSVLYATLLPSAKRRCLSQKEGTSDKAKSSSTSAMPPTTKNNKESTTAIDTWSSTSMAGIASSNLTRSVHHPSTSTFDSRNPSNTKAARASAYGGTQHTGLRGMTTGLLTLNTTVMAITEGCGVATEVGICYMHLPSGKCTLAQVNTTIFVTHNDTETPFQ